MSFRLAFFALLAVVIIAGLSPRRGPPARATWCSGDWACLYDDGLKNSAVVPRDLDPGFPAVLVAV